MGFDVVSVVTVEDDKAHYYAGASNFIIKLIADRKTLKILGVQVFGTGAVDKVVDVIVTAMSMRGTLHDIEDLDLAYAPPFSTAIHPIVHTANVLFNKINGVLESIAPAEYLDGNGTGYTVFDSCTVPTIEGAPYLELTEVNGKLEGYDLDDRLLLVCNRGRKAYLIQNRLKYYGYTNTRVLEGGVTFNKVKI
jgi:rhodanese-related sulfurtransferase